MWHWHLHHKHWWEIGLSLFIQAVIPPTQLFITL